MVTYQPFTLWFTGLPCSGKTTLSSRVAEKMLRRGLPVQHLDGDTFRKAYLIELGFSKEDRQENISRAAAIALSLIRNRTIVIASFVSPYRDMRLNSRRLMEPNFIEVYLDYPLPIICEQRDVKGMYKKAREGQIKDFTGVSDVYEVPSNPDITLKTNLLDIETCTAQILDYLAAKRFITH